MKQSTRRFAVRGCVAAACSGFVLCAAGQSVPDQTQVGLERAVKTPTEIIWLRDEILAELWRKNPRLDDSTARCADNGNVTHGCTVGDPPTWRYIFGASAHDSRFKPLTSGVYLIFPQAYRTGLVRAPSGEILLAAGTSVTLIDAAYPGIQIELTAPPDQPLPLGNLAAAEAGRMFALLARQPGAVSASAASLLDSGRVALKSADEMQIATAAPLPRVVAHTATVLRAPVEFRGTIDVSRFPSGETVKLVAEAEARLAREFIAKAQAYREPETLKLDARPVVAAAPPVPVVAETPVLPARIAAAPEPVTVTPSAPVQVASAVPALPPKSEPAREVQTIKPVLETPRAQQQVQRVASANPDIAQLRAEVEAEIARDRERLAAAMPPCSKPGASAKQGCTIGPAPRQFVFAGA